MSTVYLFADSNLFLHYKPLHEIDWSKLGDFDEIEVVVCPTVQREIDVLKDRREGRRSDRARRAASTLLEIAQHGPKKYRTASPRVTLNLYGTSQPKQDLANELDYSQNDDRIIGHLAQFKDENPSADARLLTRDSGPVLRAITLCLPYAVIPDDWRLAPEPDLRDREIQELKRQLGELQTQEPRFHFSCDQQVDERSGRIEIAYERFRPLTEVERGDLLEDLLEEYPRTASMRRRISAQAIAEFEERDHPQWVSECQEYMEVVHSIVQLEHFPELRFTIQNTGSRPATNVLVDIRTCGNFGLTAPLTELKSLELLPLERPIPPPQPQPPRNFSTILSNLAGFDNSTLPNVDFTQHLREQEDIEYATDIKIEPQASMELTCGLWRHSLEPKEFTVRIVPHTTETPITGEVICTVHADNLTKPSRFKFVITVSPGRHPDSMYSLEQALRIRLAASRWFKTPHPNEANR